MVFGGKAEGVVGGEGVICDSGGGDGAGDRAEGGVVVVRCDAIAGFKVDEFRDVLITIKGVEEFVVAGVSKHKERARCNGFGWIPNEEIHLRIVVQRIQLLHSKVIVVDKLMMRNHLTIHLFLIEDATAHTVKVHRNNCTTTLPTHGTIFCIVRDGPHAC